MTPFVIVLDGADRLPRGAAAVQHELAALPAMLAGARGRGGGFLGASSPLVALTVVLVSEHPHVASGALEAGFGLPVPFPAYTKKEASAILLRSLRVAAGLPSSSSSSSSSSCRSNTTATAATASFEALASAFSSLLVGALYASTRDVREMRRMAALLSHTYLGPLLSASAFAASSSAHDKEEKENHKEEEQGAADNCAALLPSPTALLERIQPLLARATQHCLHLPAEPLEQPTTASAAAGTVKREGGPVAKAPTATRLEMLLRYGAFHVADAEACARSLA